MKENFKTKDIVFYRGLQGEVVGVDPSQRYGIEVEFINEKLQKEIGRFDLFGNMHLSDYKFKLSKKNETRNI